MAIFELSSISKKLKRFRTFEWYFRKQLIIEVIWAKYESQNFTTVLSFSILRAHFFKRKSKICYLFLKSERIRKWILRFLTKQINPRSFRSCSVRGTEESSSWMDSLVPLMHRDPRNLGLICLVKKWKIRFQILSDLRIKSRIFLKKRTFREIESTWVKPVCPVWKLVWHIQIFPSNQRNLNPLVG